MCSSDGAPAGGSAAAADRASRLVTAIDDCAAAVRRLGGATGPDLTQRLAALWATLAEADPELAARAARYTGS